MKYCSVLFAGAVLLCAAQAQAQAQDDEQSIIVEGNREKPPSVTQSVRAITEAESGNLARFEVDVCPAVAGLPANFALTVVELMRDAVRDADVDLAPENCAPNLTLIVTDDGRALIAGMAKANARLFERLTAQEMSKLRENPGPVWSWHNTQTKRADGGPVSEGEVGRAVIVRGAVMSRLSSPVRKEINGGFVVLDLDSIDGFTLKQIAEFAVMRGLAQTRDGQSGKFGFESILNLFVDGKPTEGLTSFDREYLSSIYRGGNGFTYAQKTRQVAQDVARKENSTADDAE